MSKYEEGMKILDERFGNGKDNVISLATIDLGHNKDGQARPCVRDVDADYESGVFYIVTHAQSNKVKQIMTNPEVFSEWYDFANNENDENCCIVAIHMKKGTLRIDHGAMFYHFDFDNMTAV